MFRKDKPNPSEPRDPRPERIQEMYTKLYAMKEKLGNLLKPASIYMVKLAWLPSLKEHRRLMADEERVLDWTVEVFGHLSEWTDLITAPKAVFPAKEMVIQDADQWKAESHETALVAYINTIHVLVQQYADALFEYQAGNIPRLVPRIRFTSQALGLHSFLMNSPGHTMRIAFSDGHAPIEGEEAIEYLLVVPDTPVRARYNEKQRIITLTLPSFIS